MFKKICKVLAQSLAVIGIINLVYILAMQFTAPMPVSVMLFGTVVYYVIPILVLLGLGALFSGEQS